MYILKLFAKLISLFVSQTTVFCNVTNKKAFSVEAKIEKLSVTIFIKIIDL